MERVDDLVRQYHGLHGKALSIIDSHERVYYMACPRPECHSRCPGYPRPCPAAKRHALPGSSPGRCRRTTRHWKQKTEAWVCGSCGTEWAFDDVAVRREKFKDDVRPRSNGTEDRVVDLVEVGIALNGMLADARFQNDARALVGYAMTVASYQDLADFAREAWGLDWTEDGARSSVDRARRELLRRMGARRRRAEERRAAKMRGIPGS